MPALAPAALAVSVILSALAAVVLCVLVVLYGFTPAGEEPPGAAARRQLVTRLGHAVAAVCFAATAIVIAVILAQPPRPAAPPVAPVEARVPAPGTRLDAQESRLAQAEARLDDLERLRDGEAAGTAPRAEPAPARAVTTPRTPRTVAARRPPSTAHGASAPPDRRADLPPMAGAPPPLPADAAPPTPAPAAALPLVVGKPAPLPDAALAPPHDVEADALAAPRARPSSPPPTAVAVTPPRRAASEVTPPRPGPASPSRFDLLGRLRDDWHTIRRGVESGEDDFRRALDDTRRNVRRFLGE
ncbi:MAG TPA: hypothetical protein VFV05_11865 [Methylomirabilota bacterium]|nr:hypothetical protein [Methylomirabilota bacterium]